MYDSVIYLDHQTNGRINPMNTNHNEFTSVYDVIARSWKNEVVFTGETEKGKDWIRRHWGEPEYRVENLLSAALDVRRMNADSISVALLCGV